MLWLNKDLLALKNIPSTTHTNMDINALPEQQNSCGLLNQTHSQRCNYFSAHNKPQCEQRLKTETVFQVLFDSSLLETMAPNKAPVKQCDSTRREAETLSLPAHCCVIRTALSQSGLHVSASVSQGFLRRTTLRIAYQWLSGLACLCRSGDVYLRRDYIQLSLLNTHMWQHQGLFKTKTPFLLDTQ